jgi:uncharacterized membrane protein
MSLALFKCFSPPNRTSPNLQRVKKGLLAFSLWLVYPLAIFFGLQFLEPRYVALLLACALLIRHKLDATRFLIGLSRINVAVFVCLLTLVAVTAATNNETLLRLYPAAMSFGMLLLFGLSLKSPPSMVERFARLRNENLPQAGVLYTRRVTQVWCAFFIANGSVAVWTALYANRDVWAMYNGLIAYLVMGMLFAGEWLLRPRFLPNHSA